MESSPAIYDLAIIGGGINGCGIARDAAGRGWRVCLCEQNDLGSGTSSASTKLIHGGLRYLEYHEFRLVREALMERELLWGIAPHIIWPLRFVLPYHAKLRPRWMLRLGLFLHDHIGGRRRLPKTRVVDLTTDITGQALKPEFTRLRILRLLGRGCPPRGAERHGGRRDGGDYSAAPALPLGRTPGRTMACGAGGRADRRDHRHPGAGAG